MPIVVDEVIISVEVGNAGSGGAGEAGAGSPAPAGRSEDKQALISECVERVLEILSRREER